MKLGELWDIILHTQKDYIVTWRDLNVVIPVAESSIGAMASVAVQNADVGFDWDAGNFHIISTEAIIKKPKNHKDTKEEILDRIWDAKNKEKENILNRIRKWDGETKTELGRLLNNIKNK